MDDLHGALKDSCCISFADGVFIEDTNATLIDGTNKDFCNIAEYLNLLKFNFNTLKHTICGFTDQEYKSEFKRIQYRVSLTQFLSVIVDQRLYWTCHISYIQSELSK